MATQQTAPLNLIDEAIHHIESTFGPWNIQLEVGTHGMVDDERMRAAVRTACLRHPLARATLQPTSASAYGYQWSFPDAPKIDPFSVEDCPDEKSLSEARGRFYSRPIPLDVSPPLRAKVIHRPGGDLLMLNLSHAVMDGVGSLRFAQSVTRAYLGEDDPDDPVELGTARDLHAALSAKGSQALGRRGLDAVKLLADAVQGPARLATVGGDESRKEGFGIVTRRFDPDRTKAIIAQKPEGSTVNDLLLAALHLAVARWNGKHGKSARRVTVMMPFNVRPQDRFYEVVSNIVTYVNVSTEPRDRGGLAETARAVAKRTKALKQDRGAVIHDLLELTKTLPVGLKRKMPMLLMGTAERFVGTSVLSNLGRLADTPTLEADGSEPPELWFSPPCQMPLGAGLGVATSHGALHLALRYHVAQFDHDAATAFLDTLAEVLEKGIGEGLGD